METVKSSPEQRVLLRNVSWETYERLLEEREERQVPRFFYDRGVLEILSPSTEHEEIADLIAFLVRELAAEWEIDVRVAGHTTFRRGALSRGFEPDGSFYLSENAARVRGRANIDLDAGDPPPDLVVEVHRTSHSLDKLPIYARFGVPEVWRYVVGGTGPSGDPGTERRRGCLRTDGRESRAAAPYRRRARALRRGGSDDEVPGLGAPGA